MIAGFASPVCDYSIAPKYAKMVDYANSWNLNSQIC
jgi:hypothetical protein